MNGREKINGSLVAEIGLPNFALLNNVSGNSNFLSVFMFGFMIISD